MDYRDLAEILSTLRGQAVQFEQAHEAEQAQQNELWQTNVKPRLKDAIAQLTDERTAAKADLAKAEADVAANEKALSRQTAGIQSLSSKSKVASGSSARLQQMSIEQLRTERERQMESISTLDTQLSGVRAQLQRQHRPDERAMYEDQHMMLQVIHKPRCTHYHMLAFMALFHVNCEVIRLHAEWMRSTSALHACMASLLVYPYHLCRDALVSARCIVCLCRKPGYCCKTAEAP